MASDLKIAQIEPGKPVEGVFALVRKQRRHDKNGDAYLVIELSDDSGRIEARVWRNADWFDTSLNEGDRVRVIGRGAKFRDQIQLDLRRLDKVELSANPEEAKQSFVPASSRELSELEGELEFLIGEITHPELSALVNAVWNGELRERLLTSPATAHDHHAYLGGLVEHTVSVAAISLAAAERYRGIDSALLLSAALLHDVGRAKELRSETVIEADAENALVGHVLITHEMMLSAAREIGLSIDDLAWWPRLVHAVTNHHSSPERCRTREALILASANALDARLAGRDKQSR